LRVHESDTPRIQPGRHALHQYQPQGFFLLDPATGELWHRDSEGMWLRASLSVEVSMTIQMLEE
jgi:hypothetical protein